MKFCACGCQRPVLRRTNEPPCDFEKRSYASKACAKPTQRPSVGYGRHPGKVPLCVRAQQGPSHSQGSWWVNLSRDTFTEAVAELFHPPNAEAVEPEKSS